jgi:hypothetical protein
VPVELPCSVFGVETLEPEADAGGEEGRRRVDKLAKPDKLPGF